MAFLHHSFLRISSALLRSGLPSTEGAEDRAAMLQLTFQIIMPVGEVCARRVVETNALANVFAPDFGHLALVVARHVVVRVEAVDN